MHLNPETRDQLAKDVHFLEQDCSLKRGVPDETLDVVFTSNFLEHLRSKNALQFTLKEAFRSLRKGGKLVAMGPNIKYLAGRYRDFIDHHIPLTEASLSEALEVEGFRLEKTTARFLQFTLVNTPKCPLLCIKAYLSLPVMWPIFGGQFLIIALKP
jgi:SAM-dependent methyltransferase